MPSLPARSTSLVVCVVAVACGWLGWATDAWYGRLLFERERSTVTVQAENAARALEQEVARRIALLSGWRAFAESYNGDRERLEQDLPVFASGLITGLSGVRALQFVHEGIITASWPLANNERALGFNLSSHPNPAVGADVDRALRTKQLAITGPIELVQGGSGLVVRLATSLPAGSYPELATIILDVPTILADAGLHGSASSQRITVRDRAGDLVAGSEAQLVDPVSALVSLGDGNWTLYAVPTAGWGGAAVRREQRLLRASALVIAALLMGLAAVLAGRQARLSDAVLERTRALQAANHDLALEVDERQSAVRTLRERAEQLRLALAAGRMGVWGWDLDSGQIHWDDGVAEVFGQENAESPAAADAVLALLSATERAEVVQQVAATVDTGVPLQVELRVRGSDGAERTVLSTAELQRDPATGGKRLLGVIMDVTTRTRLEQQLHHAQKMDAVGTLAGGIAHDFNNLLTAILGFARLAHETIDRASSLDAQALEGVRDDLSELIRAGDRAALLTAQLLAFSRQQVVQSIPVDVNGVVEELKRMLSRLLDERITLITEPATAPAVVRGDPGQLSQVLLNLVVNARDAMPEGGTITVSTARHVLDGGSPANGVVANEEIVDGDWVELRVSDTGSGMSGEVQSRMFEPFFTTKPTGQGTGLGLSTVYGIVSAVGGRILVESREGAGTTIRVLWPAITDGSVVATHSDEHRIAVRGGETILVVEDEPGVRRLVSEILKRYGHHVLLAANGAEALEVLASNAADPIALVISDVVMPEMGGLALLAQMRSLHPNVPMLLMSGYPASSVDEPQVEIPILTKPFAPRDLLARVRALIDVAPLPPVARVL